MNTLCGHIRQQGADVMRLELEQMLSLLDQLNIELAEVSDSMIYRIDQF